MLHAHVPEHVQNFGKHLIATFLGLLMALGLEQWAVHHHEMKVAHEAMARVEQELSENLANLDRQRSRARTSMKTLDDLDTFLVAQMEAKQARRPVQERIPEGDLGVGIGFKTDAWESLKLSGAFRNLPPERAARLSAAYSFLQDFGQIVRSYPGADRNQRGMVLLLAPQRRFQNWDAKEFQDLRESLWQFREFFRWVDQELAWMRPALEKAVRP